MTKPLRPFHLAFPIYDINSTIHWYQNILGCKIGRQDKKWVDFDFFGHQISGHLAHKKNTPTQSNLVDGKDIPIRHFGIILDFGDWNKLSKKLISKNIDFIISPNTRFKGETGEQSTFFIADPNGNVLEFKSFKDDKMIFDN
jgi:extradiol dioxygenase family protein